VPGGEAPKKAKGLFGGLGLWGVGGGGGTKMWKKVWFSIGLSGGVRVQGSNPQANTEGSVASNTGTRSAEAAKKSEEKGGEERVNRNRRLTFRGSGGEVRNSSRVREEPEKKLGGTPQIAGGPTRG